MARFNKVSSGTKTVNLAGGEAFAMSAKLELASILFTSFAKDKFYRSANAEIVRLRELIASIPDKEFVAKCAVYARTRFGMRSITHVVVAELAKIVKGEPWMKHFISAAIFRPDDATEILAYYLGTYKKPIPNSLKKGIGNGLGKFNEYQLAKYRSEGSAVKLIDVLNIVHPKPTERAAAAYTKLAKGSLVSEGTWESMLTRAGQNASDESEKLSLKAEAWKSLLESNKLGYFALLRNLRNIMEQAPGMLGLALERLVDEEAIKSSLVLPFRFTTAHKEFASSTDNKARDVIYSLSKAVDISLSNVPKRTGNSLVALDVSGSMQGKPAEIGALFAAVLCKAWGADLMTFDSSARYVQYNRADSALTIAKAIPFTGGGTDFSPIFNGNSNRYDRIVLLSDMQGWIGHYAPTAAFGAWKRRTDSDPFVYSFDLQGYGSLQMPESNVACLAGFSEKIFDIMEFLEEDKNALLKKIESVTFDYAKDSKLETA